MRGPPVVLTNTLGRPVTNVISGAVPMVVVNTLGEPVTLVAQGGEPVTLFNADGTAYGDLARLIALSPSLLIWPAEGAGWQGTSGGTLAASGQPLGLGADLSQLGGKTLSEWLATAPELVTASAETPANWTQTNGTLTFSAGVWTFTNTTASDQRAQFSITVPNNTLCVFSAEVLSPSSNTTVNAGRIAAVGYTDTASNGVATAEDVWQPINLVVRSTSTTFNIFLECATSGAWGSNGDFARFRNLSVKTVAGNHLRAGTWASPSDSARGMFQNNAINFDGVNDYYSLLNAISITTNMTVVRAFKRASAGISAVGLNTTAGGPGDFVWFGSDNGRANQMNNFVLTAAVSTAGGSFVTSSRRNATTQSIRQNGADVALNSATAGTVTGSVSLLGRFSTLYNSGEISFVAVFPSELTGADLALVEQIAASTNGTTLA